MLACLLAACTVSYKFTGTSINYDIIKTIQIDNIPNRAPYGWAPMEAMFNNQLQDLYANQTRLQLVKRGGDLHISGEITGYDQFNKSISADGYSSQVQLQQNIQQLLEHILRELPYMLVVMRKLLYLLLLYLTQQAFHLVISQLPIILLQ